MIGEVIAIGDELTSGRILNSTSTFAAHHLFAKGHELVAMATVGDSPESIGATLLKALARADFIIVTGGLGATSDDLTNEAVASALGRPATFHPEILAKIEQYLAEHNGGSLALPAVGNLEKLAWLPAGAEVLKPEARMAGYLLVHDEKPIFFLPGVPHEMKELLVDCVIPRLAAWKGQQARQVRQLVYKVFGLAETEINRRLRHLENDNSLIRIGYYPSYPEVHVSLTALGADREEVEGLAKLFDAKIKEALAEHIYGFENDTIEAIVGELLLAHNQTLAVAESCSGGLIAHRLTRVAGSSAYFLGGVVAYTNAVKERLLGVGGEIIRRYGAVSSQTASAMASGIREVTGADLGISVTGIAGPGGGSPAKPVGMVYIGLAAVSGTRTHLFQFGGDREQVQAMTAQMALDLVRRRLQGIE